VAERGARAPARGEHEGARRRPPTSHQEPPGE
jgi:hypothetical protein